MVDLFRGQEHSGLDLGLSRSVGHKRRRSGAHVVRQISDDEDIRISEGIVEGLQPPPKALEDPRDRLPAAVPLGHLPPLLQRVENEDHRDACWLDPEQKRSRREAVIGVGEGAAEAVPEETP